MVGSQTGARRFFDLNIEMVLEHWGVAEAIREVIANALDEQALSGTSDPVIEKDEQARWHIRDFGRGLKYEHLTQNEDAEKLAKPNLVVGKFGVGLKDALATFDRNGIGVHIFSRLGDISLEKAPKHDFGDVMTLHAVVEPASRPGMNGTEFILAGVEDVALEVAKAYFLRCSGDEELERNEYGAVLRRRRQAANIYVNGLRVATEDNFLFSYDITSLTAPLRRALNRERSNVGRTAYQDRVKAILTSCESAGVASELADDLERLTQGLGHDETKWIDIGTRATQILAANQKTVFVTGTQMFTQAGSVQRAKEDGYRIVVVPDTIAQRLPAVMDVKGEPVLDVGRFLQVWNESFTFDFVALNQLEKAEREVWRTFAELWKVVGSNARHVKEVRISNTMRMRTDGRAQAEGVWDPGNQWIVVKRSCLDSAAHFAAVLLHELGHSMSGAGDVSEEFEAALTTLLGQTGSKAAR